MLKGINILVAEDNNLNQRIVNYILQKQEAVVRIVSNGAEALEQLREKNFDVILMDLQMPELDGYQATEHIRQVMKNTLPIIALSATKYDVDVQKSIDAGMNACISKPFDPVELCELILKLLNEHKITS